MELLCGWHLCIHQALFDWICFVRTKFVIYDKIKFTYEQESNNRLPFFNILCIGNYEEINTTVFRKDTHNDLYSHWELFSTISRKWGILKSLISRAYMICSNQSLLKRELEHLKMCFIKRMVTLCGWLIKL